MGDQSIRRHLAALDQQGELIRFAEEIDPDENMSAVSWKAFSERGKSCLFENVKGHPDWRVASQIVANRRKWGIALGVDEADVVPALNRRIHDPIEPQLVDAADAPVKEFVALGKDVDLTKLPAMWTSERDPGRYIASGMCVIKDPNTGIRNVSVHRAQIIAADRTGYLICPRQALKIFQMYSERNRPMEAAMVIGCHPAMMFSAGFVAPYGQDELTIAGGLLGEPVRLVKCETIDMEVPAEAELVLEGELWPNETTPEGPFGEVTGTYAQEGSTPIFRVKAVTRRKDPIFYAMQCGLPPSDTHSIICTTIEMRLWDHLRSVAGGVDLLDVRCIGGMTPMMVVVKLRPQFDGQVRSALIAALSSPYLHPKIAVAVDEHVDAGDVGQVFRAVARAADPATDMQKVNRTRVFALDNASPIEAGMSAMYRVGTKVLIDATGAGPSDDSTNGHPDRDAVARLLGVEVATAVSKLADRLDTQVAPRTVPAAKAPIHARTQTGSDIDLWRFAGGAGLHGGILVADLGESQRMGLVGWRADGAQRLTATGLQWRLRSVMDVGMPVAIVAGAGAAACAGAALAAASGRPGWVSAGSLSEHVLDVVEGPGGITVPAAADFVIFGRVTTDGADLAVDVTDVWCGNDRADVSTSADMDGYEALAVELTIAHHLRNVEGGIDVRDVRSYAETGHRLVTIKIRPRVEGQSKTALMAAVSSPDLRPSLAVAVDEDINAGDLRDVAWSIASRLHAEYDVASLGGAGENGGKWFFDSTMPPPTQPERRRAFERAMPKNLASVDLAEFLPPGTG